MTMRSTIALRRSSITTNHRERSPAWYGEFVLVAPIIRDYTKARAASRANLAKANIELRRLRG